MTDKYEMLTFLSGCFLILRIGESVIQYFNYLFCIFHLIEQGSANTDFLEERLYTLHISTK